MSKYDCLTVAPGHGRLAWPGDHRALDYLSSLAKDSYKVDQVWVGLDDRSDFAPNPMWTSNEGAQVTEVRWAGGAPIQDASKQCVYMDHASGG